MHIQTAEEIKKKIFSIVESLEPLELNSLEHYAEFLAQRSNDLRFLEILRNAESEDEELDPSEIEALKYQKNKLREVNSGILTNTPGNAG